MDISITLILVMVSWKFAYTQTYQTVFINYLNIFFMLIISHYAILKSPILGHKG